MQHLQEQGKLRVQRDFDAWLLHHSITPSQAHVEYPLFVPPHEDAQQLPNARSRTQESSESSRPIDPHHRAQEQCGRAETGSCPSSRSSSHSHRRTTGHGQEQQETFWNATPAGTVPLVYSDTMPSTQAAQHVTRVEVRAGSAHTSSVVSGSASLAGRGARHMHASVVKSVQSCFLSFLVRLYL